MCVQGPVCSRAPGGTQPHSRQHRLQQPQQQPSKTKFQASNQDVEDSVPHSGCDGRANACPRWGPFFRDAQGETRPGDQGLPGVA